MSENNISENARWEKEFWIFWGLSPEGTPKHKAGLKAIEFISKARNDALDEGWNNCVCEIKEYIQALGGSQEHDKEVKTLMEIIKKLKTPQK